MSKLKTTLLLILLAFSCHYSNAQEEGDFDEKYETNPKYKGVALDVFPLINNIFSDDGSSNLFQVNYIWGKGKQHHEFGLSPQYAHLKSEQDVSDQTIIGATIELFSGKQFDIGTKWQGVWGVRFNYGYQLQTSKLFQSNDTERKTQTHTAGLGPEFMFGYKLSDQVLIRSRVAALLRFRDATTKIGDGPFNAGNQSLTIIEFEFNAPSMLEIVFIF